MEKTVFSVINQAQRQILHDPLIWNLKTLVTKDWGVEGEME